MIAHQSSMQNLSTGSGNTNPKMDVSNNNVPAEQPQDSIGDNSKITSRSGASPTLLQFPDLSVLERLERRSSVQSRERRKEEKNKERKTKKERGKYCRKSRDLILLLDAHMKMFDGLHPEKKLLFMRNQVPIILGTQQMRFKLKTGLTTLINGSPTLNQVVAMDVTGISAWSSWANLFDEYRVHKAKLHILPMQCYVPSTASTGTVNVSIAAGVVVDYDDATAIANTTQMMQYDTLRTVFLGRTDETHSTITAYPEGIPDLSWVTTSSPTVPFWWKFYHFVNPPANSMALATLYIELDIEFRQVG